MDPIVVPSHSGLALPLVSYTVAAISLYTMTLMQIYLYFTKYVHLGSSKADLRHPETQISRHGRQPTSLKGFVVYLLVVETVQIVLAGGWIWVVQYWEDYRDILTIFIWARFATINAVGGSQICLAIEIRRAMKKKGLRLQTLFPVVMTAMTILEMVSYIVILVHSLWDLETSYVNQIMVAFSRANWAVNAAMSVVIAGLFLRSHFNPTSDEERVSPKNPAGVALTWILNSGLGTASFCLLFLISMKTASDLELFSATTLLHVPLHVNMFLTCLNTRLIEPRAAAKPPSLSPSGVTNCHQGDAVPDIAASSEDSNILKP